MIGRYADARLNQFSEPELAKFEAFLVVSEPLIQGWIFGTERAHKTEFADLVTDIRKFHGLENEHGG